MKKIFVFLLIFLSSSTYQSCSFEKIDNPLREPYTEEEFNLLVEDLKLSVVTMLDYYLDFDLGLGSGMIFKKEEASPNTYYYYVLTNNHVVEGVTRIMIKTAFDTLEEGDIYAFPSDDEMTRGNEDIAIVRFESSFEYPLIPIIPYEDENTHVQLSVGQTVFGIGTPTEEENHNLVTNLGIITNLSNSFISHTANINAGNSGGPLFSSDGTFIGVNTQRLETLRDRDMELVYLINDSIDVNQTAKMIKRRLDGVTPKIGIQIVTYSNFISIDYSVFGDEGMLFDPYDHVPVNEVGVVIIEVNSTRSSSGILQRYDLIKKVDGKTVVSNEQLIDMLSPIIKGKTYTFEVIRKNEVTNKFETKVLDVTINR
ncbi:MAG: S1C family serine protease [Acholeplasmataceae bacterium]